jgi:hypothetical protein
MQPSYRTEVSKATTLHKCSGHLTVSGCMDYNYLLLILQRAMCSQERFLQSYFLLLPCNTILINVKDNFIILRFLVLFVTLICSYNMHMAFFIYERYFYLSFKWQWFNRIPNIFYISELLSVWAFLSSGILEIRKHDVSETRSVPETSCSLVSRIPDEEKIPKKKKQQL